MRIYVYNSKLHKMVQVVVKGYYYKHFHKPKLLRAMSHKEIDQLARDCFGGEVK